MLKSSEIIYLVEDDPRILSTLTDLLVSLGRETLSFGTAEEFLAHVRTDANACLIVKIELPDIDGLELQRQMADRMGPPIIFITERGSVASTVAAMKAGAVECLTHPLDSEALVSAIETALARDRRIRRKHADRLKLRERLCSLTPRQREVFPLVVGGLLNKQAAAILEISEVTLQIHRSQIMRKMAAETFAELVRMAVKLRIPYWREASDARCASWSRKVPDRQT